MGLKPQAVLEALHGGQIISTPVFAIDNSTAVAANIARKFSEMDGTNADNSKGLFEAMLRGIAPLVYRPAAVEAGSTDFYDVLFMYETEDEELERVLLVLPKTIDICYTAHSFIQRHNVSP